MRVAAIDCGTNTIKLLIADLHRGNEVELVREIRMVRLGEGVDKTGRLSDGALARAFAALDEYAEMIAAHDVSATRFCATSAARDASNAEVFRAGVQARLGVTPEVVPGDEEAALSFAGATRSVDASLRPPYLVIDIGGGSTELILGNADGSIVSAQSLDIGSVRMTERHLHSDPPTAEELAAAIADIDGALDGCSVPVSQANAVIGVAGSITTTAAMVLGLSHYDRQALNNLTITVADASRAAHDLLAMTVAERRALGFMHPGRADVIGAGALILDRVLRRTSVSTMEVSESDILDGIAWSLVVD